MRSVHDSEFLSTINNWIDATGEVCLLVRYSHSAGAKDIVLLHSIQRVAELMSALPARAHVIAFKKTQMPLRGLVDANLITRAEQMLPEGTEYVVLCLDSTSDPQWVAGFSREELRVDLSTLSGRNVAVGAYPPWLEEGNEVMSGLAPDEDGHLRQGVY